MKNRIVIPDIHGEYDKFMRLLDTLKYEPGRDLLILLGDYVDRGPDSRLVVRQLKAMQEHGAIVLAGNHEYLMIDAVKDGLTPVGSLNYDQMMRTAMGLWLMNCGGVTMRSYSKAYPYPTPDTVWQRDMAADAAWLESLPLWHEDDDYFYSHAPVPARLAYYDLAKTSRQILTWSYGEPEDTFAMAIPGKIGVCGHVHALQRGVKCPRLYDHYYYLDAGCGCHPDAPLFAFNLDTRQLYSSKGEVTHET